MNSIPNTLEDLISQEYRHGFETAIEADEIPKGLSEDTVRLISARKNEPEFLLE
jgi:Iron-regulated ABC transporter membrane component SufB